MKPEQVAIRYQRRYPEQRFRFALWSEFAVGDMLPGTIVYQRLVLAIALQQVIHALRRVLP